MSLETKTCIDCGISKTLEDFHKRKDSPDGYRNNCKDCKRAKDKRYCAENSSRKVQKVREWRHKNASKYAEYNKIHWQKIKEEKLPQQRQYYQANKQKFRDNTKAWKTRNRDKWLATEAGYRDRNRAKVNAKSLEYYYSNKDKYLDRSRLRRARILNSEGSFTSTQFKALCSIYNNTCICCGATNVKLTADHVIPISRGGKNTIDNIQPLCSTCNKKKSVKTIDYRISSIAQGVLQCQEVFHGMA